MIPALLMGALPDHRSHNDPILAPIILITRIILIILAVSSLPDRSL